MSKTVWSLTWFIPDSNHWKDMDTSSVLIGIFESDEQAIAAKKKLQEYIFPPIYPIEMMDWWNDDKNWTIKSFELNSYRPAEETFVIQFRGTT